jgi:hypothetical protein
MGRRSIGAAILVDVGRMIRWRMADGRWRIGFGCEICNLKLNVMGLRDERANKLGPSGWQIVDGGLEIGNWKIGRWWD